MVSGEHLIGLPAALAGLHKRQKPLMEKFAKGRNIFEAMIFRLRVTAFGDHLFHLVRLGAGIRQRDFVAPTDAIHPNPPPCIAVAEIKGSSAARADLQHEPLSLGIKIIDQANRGTATRQGV